MANMESVIQYQNDLQNQARQLLESTPVLDMLNRLGKVTQTGSSVTGLMVYPDIDFAVQTRRPDIEDAIKLVPQVFSDLLATSCKVADFRNNQAEGASYFIGFEFPFADTSWQISATVGGPGPILTNPPELTDWLNSMSKGQRLTILRLEKELISKKRYAGAKSQPPYTFRSVHVYEAVIKGGAKKLGDIEKYF